MTWVRFVVRCANSCACASILMKISNLVAARNGVVNNPSKSLRILEMPLSLETAYSVICGEADLLEEVLNDGDHDASLSALKSLQREKTEAKEKPTEAVVEKNEDQSMLSSFMNSWNGCLAGGFSFDEVFCGCDLGNVDDGTHINGNTAESSMIYTLGDAKSNKELVYAIEVNPSAERITVIFRGSVTKVDFAVDANINMKHVAEPLLHAGASGDSYNVGIHQGHYDFLFGSKKGKPSKYDEIISHIQTLFRQDPARRRCYKLYVTGHGLGGSLATLFGYFCAASSSGKQLSFAPPSRNEDILPIPITVVSIASPRVGDLSFARSFTELESRAKLRHLRIAAYKDPVTLSPIYSSEIPLTVDGNFSPLGSLIFKMSPEVDNVEGMYYHTGVLMELRDDIPATTSQRVELSYCAAGCFSEPLSLSCPSDLYDDSNATKRSKTSGALAMASFHFGDEYAKRLALVDTDISGLTLNRIYQDRACLHHNH